MKLSKNEWFNHRYHITENKFEFEVTCKDRTGLPNRIAWCEFADLMSGQKEEIRQLLDEGKEPVYDFEALGKKYGFSFLISVFADTPVNGSSSLGDIVVRPTYPTATPDALGTVAIFSLFSPSEAECFLDETQRESISLMATVGDIEISAHTFYKKGEEEERCS